MLNINEIEKVTEKQVIKPELSADPGINNIENMNNDILAEDLMLESDSELAGDLANDLDGDLENDQLSADQSMDQLAEEGTLQTELHAKQNLQDNLDLGDSYNDFDVDSIDNILDLKPDQFPRFTLAKNKARFLRMVSDYRSKQEWLDVAPLSGVAKLFKTQTKELVGIRAKKLDYEMEIEMGTLTPVQISHRRDELKMCKVQEKMAVSLISKMQVKIRSGRR